MKECSNCHILQPRSEFATCKKSADGLDWWCKSCKRTSSTKSKHKKPVNTIYYDVFKAGKYKFF